MAVNPNSLKNLDKAVRFKSGDSRIKAGRKRGIKNRKTLIEEVLGIRSECTDFAGNMVKLPQAYQVAIAMVNKAKLGDVSAANFVFDSAYGKIGTEPDPVPEPVEPQIDWSKYTDEELLLLSSLMEKGVNG